jgi:TonB family protein
VGASFSGQSAASTLTANRKGADVNFVKIVIAGLILIAGTTVASTSSASAPKPASSVLPVYPEGARQARVAGTVTLWFELNGNGGVAQVGIASGNPLLRDAAMEVVRSWRFQPNTLPPNVRFETEFVYVLNVQAKEGEPKLTVSMTDFRHVKVVSELYVRPME